MPQENQNEKPTFNQLNLMRLLRFNTLQELNEWLDKDPLSNSGTSEPPYEDYEYLAMDSQEETRELLLEELHQALRQLK